MLEPTRRTARWTLDLLAGELVRLTSHETLSGGSVAGVDLKQSRMGGGRLAGRWRAEQRGDRGGRVAR